MAMSVRTAGLSKFFFALREHRELIEDTHSARGYRLTMRSHALAGSIGFAVTANINRSRSVHRYRHSSTARSTIASWKSKTRSAHNLAMSM